MSWRRPAPKAEGYYWLCQDGHVRLVYVYRGEWWVPGHAEGVQVAATVGDVWWMGPIKKPEGPA